MDGTFVIEQFGYEFKVGHILQVPALFHLQGDDADSSNDQSYHCSGKSHLHIVAMEEMSPCAKPTSAGPIGMRVPISPNIGPSLMKVRRNGPNSFSASTS